MASGSRTTSQAIEEPILLPPNVAEFKTNTEVTGPQANYPRSAPKGSRYFAIIAALCVVSSLHALKGIVVSTALPFIVRELGAGKRMCGW